ncbi:DNA-3-methyladenine glycosylase family protein [Aeromicrobium wangtongii]|uniref:DNA-3-methyladenine glycosylase 2 family protein n=1 Tax=Aeromicrobium wangtongii TaxID=2969247 RepID=A0ABY5M4Z4_9ACTN|nr:DNA-3-methyladenine glycosylase 2 family protein [Aeromicrobium wangtongii]MCD9198086.1 DNA-3-methyladenine glycosylase 2 family protein [Aeromicrobium wangtongii]UUP12126.1 DNA-3-methyladenine glycosylase 2 family protein [Aeromicrobium wangtongii]
MRSTLSDPVTRDVHVTSPVNVYLTLSLLRRGPGDPTFRRDGSRIWRTSRMATGPVTYAIEPRSATHVRAQAWGPGSDELIERVPQLIGAEDDPTSFEPRHPLLADGVRRFPGLRVPRTGRVLEALIPAIIEQKVLGIDAFAAQRRLLRRFGEAAPGPAPEGMLVTPDAEHWAAIPSWEWHLAGVDPRRARAAQASAKVAAQLERLAESGDDAAVYRAMRSIPGVGVWTAAEVGYRALGDADAVPFGDFHVAKDTGTALIGRRIDDAELATLLEPWRGHRFRVVRLVQLSPLAARDRRGPRMARVDHRHI